MKFDDHMNKFKNFQPQAVIFDKDGTLIDFDAMWGEWTLYLAKQINQVSGLDVSTSLCDAFGYDETNKKVIPGGKLASNPMSVLYDLTIQVVHSSGFSVENAQQIVDQIWAIPDPVLLAKPLTDLRTLFESLTARGIKIAIATADDRTPTQAMIEALDIEEFISCIVCADDGITSKPAPDMAISLCKKMDVEPSQTIVIGDTISDLKMARAAGAGMAVGVLSGVSNARDLVQYADLLIESIEELDEIIEEITNSEQEPSNNGLNPDYAF